jgi:hypothetical protein
MRLLSATVRARGTSVRSCEGRVQSRVLLVSCTQGFCRILQSEIVRDQNEITGEYVTLNRIARIVECEL